MVYYMTSKSLNTFLNEERDKDILNAQYVLVSSRIRVKDRKTYDNILQAKNMLFPDANVCNRTNEDDFRDAYFKQLDGCRATLATILKGAIEEGYNIIFLCTKNEGKMKFLEHIASYMYIEFGYPVYNYDDYQSGKCSLIKYNKKKVLKKANKVLKKAKDNMEENMKSTEKGRKELIKNYKSMSKKKLKKLLKKKDLYEPGMDKSDMIDTLELFM